MSYRYRAALINAALISSLTVLIFVFVSQTPALSTISFLLEDCHVAYLIVDGVVFRPGSNDGQNVRRPLPFLPNGKATVASDVTNANTMNVKKPFTSNHHNHTVDG